MDDVDKTKERLIDELRQLRQRLAELEVAKTEHSKAEDMLSEYERHYRDILDHMLEGCQIIGFDWRYLYLNEVAASYKQQLKEKLLGQTMMEACPRIEKTEMFAQLRRCMEKRVSHYMENEFIFPDGSKGCFELSMEPVPEGVLIRSRDITEQKKIEEVLKQSEAKYRELAESITDIFFAMDEDLRYTYWNKASEKLTGIPAKDALGKHIFDIFPDDENTRKAESLYRKALATKKPQYLIHRLPIGGRDFVFEINAYPTASALCVYVRDITESKKMEKALEESELYYRHIFDNAPFGISFSSVDGRVVNQNKAMENISGYSIEDLSKFDVANMYVNKADREILLREIRRYGGVVDYPLVLKRKDGTHYDALVSNRLTTIGDREFIQTICHDVTERKKAEEALRESELRFRTFFENAPAYCHMVSPEGKILDINNSALSTLGYTEEELIGKSLINTVYAPQSRRKARRLFKKWQETGKIENEELKIRTKEGVERTVLLSADAVRDTEGKFLYSVLMQRDITERKKAEEALRLSEQNFRDSIENSPLGIRVVSEDGKTLYANQTLLAVYGYSSLEELISVPSKQRYTPESYAEHRKRIEKRKRGEYVPPNYEISIVRKDGQVRHLAVSRGEVFWDGEKQFQVLYQDITERKEAEE
ncbi:MAG: PAS domain S-box protein, partial [Kosmotogaceae bacterium]|nr:PAS domain S-box protein [Kosmotogaceae bacterium]